MHKSSLESWQHTHDFGVSTPTLAERNTRIVLWLTAVTMVVEIITGSLSGSMALLADGWHMATHVAAFGISVFAYHYTRRNAHNPTYTFGTGKVSTLGGFASAVTLAVIAFLMVFESIGRFFQVQTIQFNEAIAVAVIGLVVNLGSAWLLQSETDHDHHHGGHGHAADHSSGHSHEHGHHHRHDHNLRAAYIHVLADALTSVLAIVALLAGKWLGWIWLDPMMGCVGAAVILKWAYGLVKDTSTILLDGTVDKSIQLKIIEAIESDDDNRVTDLHLWAIGNNSLAAVISLVTHAPKDPSTYKRLLSHLPRLVHITVEVNHCH